MLLVGFPDDNNSASFKCKQQITSQTGNQRTVDVEIIVPLKYLSNFWRPLEILINCEIILIFTWTAKRFIIANAIDSQVPTFAITDTKLYVPVVTLSTQDNVKLLDQLKSRFKRKIKWNKYPSKASIQEQNQYFHYLIDPIFQGVNRLYVLSYENNSHKTSCK